MADFTWTCPYCGRNNFKTQGGLTKHQKSNPGCRKQIFQNYGYNFDQLAAANILQLNNVPFAQDDSSVGNCQQPVATLQKRRYVNRNNHL